MTLLAFGVADRRFIVSKCSLGESYPDDEHERAAVYAGWSGVISSSLPWRCAPEFAGQGCRVFSSQADALEIEAAAKRRLADEYDGVQAGVFHRFTETVKDSSFLI